jgi:hypothetical protein
LERERGRISRFINTVGLYRGQNRIGDARWNEVARVNQRLEGLSTLDRLLIDPRRNRVVAECVSIAASAPWSQNVIGGVQHCHEHPTPRTFRSKGGKKAVNLVATERVHQDDGRTPRAKEASGELR